MSQRHCHHLSANQQAEVRREVDEEYATVCKGSPAEVHRVALKRVLHEQLAGGHADLNLDGGLWLFHTHALAVPRKDP